MITFDLTEIFQVFYNVNITNISKNKSKLYVPLKKASTCVTINKFILIKICCRLGVMVRLRSGAQNAWASVSETHLVTGGGGYPGYRLGKALLQKGYNVVLFDIREPCDSVEGMEFIKVWLIQFDSFYKYQYLIDLKFT